MTQRTRQTSLASKINLKPLALAAAVAALAAGNAQAFKFKFENGVEGSLDTTVSWGIAARVQGQDSSLIGQANGGQSRSVNDDDGNLAYSKGDIWSNLFKSTHELELKYGQFGAFVRGTAFYDYENADRANLGPIGKKRVGRDAKFLDAYLTFSNSPTKTRVRLGSQVVSWGESTFLPNGINVINPVDVGKLRVPGSELKEAFIPSQMLWLSQGITNDLSVEGFALFNFDKTRIDPKGSYFSNNDAVSEDADRVILSFGRRRDQNSRIGNPAFFTPQQIASSATLQQVNAALTATFGPATTDASIWAPRINDRPARDSGQYGFALRYLAPWANNTEFGAYAINYHSRLPYFSGIRGTATAVTTGTPFQGTLCAITASYCFTGTAKYFVEYPEDIRMFGFSANTSGPFGIALQGEYSYRPNLPLQLASAELILAVLGLPNVVTGATVIPGLLASGQTAAALVPEGQEISGWRRVKSSQFQMTGTKALPQILGAEQGVLVGEFGYTKYHNLTPGLLFAGPGAGLASLPLAATATGSSSIQETGYFTKTSYGYRLAGRLEYANGPFSTTMTPRFAFAHDIKGTSQTFTEGVKSVSLGMLFDYQKKLQLDMSYTNFFGGRSFCGVDNPPTSQALLAGQSNSFCTSANGIKDRDFIAMSVSYAF
jgi:hypothetical protein